MNKINDLYLVKEHIEKTNNKYVRGILKRLIKKGGLDAVISYLEIYECCMNVMFRHHFHEEDMNLRLKNLEDTLFNLSEQLSVGRYLFNTLTSLKKFEEEKPTLERHMYDRQNQN